MSIRFRFGDPQANCIALGVMSPNIRFDEIVATSPEDPVHGIANAALAAAAGREGTCVLHAGAEAYALSFVPSADGLRLDIVVWPDRSREPGRSVLVFQARGTAASVLLPVWRGLRDLAARWPADGWAAPFPAETVAQLGGALAATRI
ncbi:MAG: hypothetical protein ACK4YP_15315 [Myxococcota bacterium]